MKRRVGKRVREANWGQSDGMEWKKWEDERERKRSLCVVCEPDGGKMAPAEFADDEVPAVGEGVADVYGMVPALDVVLPVLLVLGHDRMGVRRVVGASV